SLPRAEWVAVPAVESEPMIGVIQFGKRLLEAAQVDRESATFAALGGREREEVVAANRRQTVAVRVIILVGSLQRAGHQPLARKHRLAVWPRNDVAKFPLVVALNHASFENEGR